MFQVVLSFSLFGNFFNTFLLHWWSKHHHEQLTFLAFAARLLHITVKKFYWPWKWLFQQLKAAQRSLTSTTIWKPSFNTPLTSNYYNYHKKTVYLVKIIEAALICSITKIIFNFTVCKMTSCFTTSFISYTLSSYSITIFIFLIICMWTNIERKTTSGLQQKCENIFICVPSITKDRNLAAVHFCSSVMSH